MENSRSPAPPAVEWRRLATADSKLRGLCLLGEEPRRHPSIAEAGVVLDLVECRIDLVKFPTDPLDQATHIGAIAIEVAMPLDIPAVHQVIKLAVGNVAPGPGSEARDDTEFRQRQIDRRVVP